MNIIHLVLGKANPDRMNGVNKVVDNLCKQQTALGYNTSVWGITPTPEESTSERPYSLKLFPSTKNKFTVHKSVETAIANIDTLTVFHLHGGFIPEFYHVAKLLKKYKHEFVFTPHGNYASNAMRKNSLYKYVYFNLFEKIILNNSKAVQCLGNGEWEDLQKIISISHSVIIPNGQNIEEITIKSSPDLKKNWPVFGFCGRVTKDQKGLDLLMEGFNLYIQQGGEGKLWIIGTGDYLKEMQKNAFDLIYEEKVIFWGPQYGDHKFKLLASMDAFYHPSRNEGLPTAVLEASAAGIPSVVSSYTNMGEYLTTHKAGILLAENTPQAIAESMKQMELFKTAGILESMGKRASEMIRTHFDWTRIAKTLLEVYHRETIKI